MPEIWLAGERKRYHCAASPPPRLNVSELEHAELDHGRLGHVKLAHGRLGHRRLRHGRLDHGRLDHGRPNRAKPEHAVRIGVEPLAGKTSHVMSNTSLFIFG